MCHRRSFLFSNFPPIFGLFFFLCAACSFFPSRLLHFGSVSRALLALSIHNTGAACSPDWKAAHPLCCSLLRIHFSLAKKKKKVGSLPWSVYLWINEKLIISDKPEPVPRQNNRGFQEAGKKRKRERKEGKNRGVSFLFERQSEGSVSALKCSAHESMMKLICPPLSRLQEHIGKSKLYICLCQSCKNGGRIN